MNTRTRLAAAMAALGLICAVTTQADQVNPRAEAAATKPVEPEHAEPAATMLSFDYVVHEGVTKEVFRLKQHGKLKLKNKSSDKILRIEAKAEKPPFVVPDNPTAQSELIVPPNSTIEVTIARNYEPGDSFIFRSQIDGSDPNDPIVIIERP